MEALENIRDTNWIKFSSDYENCWRTKDYNPLCIGNIDGSTILSPGSYILTQSGTLWTLSGTVVPSETHNVYKEQFPLFFDLNGLIANSGNNTPCTPLKTSDCRTIFTREIQIFYPDSDHMRVNSIVKWVDSSKVSEPYTINLETVFTNWKKKF